MNGLTRYLISEGPPVELLRIIRNACREGFSNDTGYIDLAQQQEWWISNKANLLGWLYRDGHELLVGYGLLRRTDDGRWWSSVAVLPAHTGHGYGKAITADIIRNCPAAVVWATARRDNPAAVKLHDLADWIEISGSDPRLMYFRTKDRAGFPAEAVEQWAETGWGLSA